MGREETSFIAAVGRRAVQWCLMACAVVPLLACGAEPVAPPVVVQTDAPKAKQETFPKLHQRRRELASQTLAGYVLLRSHGVKWHSLKAARAATSVTPSGPLVVHRVVADHGTVVEVQPQPQLSWKAREAQPQHCYSGSYSSIGAFQLNAFVRKVDLELTLAQPETVEMSADTRYRLQSGLAVTQHDGRPMVAIAGVWLPLPKQAKLALSYNQLERNDEEPDSTSEYRAKGRLKRVQLESDARLTMGELTLTGWYQKRPQHDDVHVRGGWERRARQLEEQGDELLVSLASECADVRALVSKKELVGKRSFASGGGGTIGIGIGGGGSGYGLAGRARKRPPKPAPKRHYAAKGTVVRWKQGRAIAGKLAGAVSSYALKQPLCMAVDQGYVGDPRVCVAVSDIRRDCRLACSRDGLCSVSDDGLRCIATRAESCRQSSRCTQKGACSLHKQACVVAEDDDCLGSYHCKHRPFACMAHHGKCLVTPNPDCANRPACVEQGRCHADDVGNCIAADDAACAASAACTTAGKCALSGDECQPRQHKHCRNSDLCSAYGRCSRDGGACVASSDRDCGYSRACKERGACELLTRREPSMMGLNGGRGRKTHYCGPGAAGDCRNSSRCRTKKRGCDMVKGIGGLQRCGEK